jgi:very-short-patch-repair endonuclease
MRVKLTPLARSLRRRQTEAEGRLWQYLRTSQMDGLKFRRQVPRVNFIADFLCDEAMLIIELDGSQHAERSIEDEKRTRYLESLGYKVIRFWNVDVMTNIEGTLDLLYAEASARRKTPSSGLRPPSPQGEKDAIATTENKQQ